MFSSTQDSKTKNQKAKSLLAKLSDAKKFSEDSQFSETSTKSYSDQISKKLLQKVEASLS